MLLELDADQRLWQETVRDDLRSALKRAEAGELMPRGTAEHHAAMARPTNLAVSPAHVGQNS